MSDRAPTLRPETPADAPAVRALLITAFAGPDEAELVEALRAAGDAEIALVADDHRQVVGHLVLSPLRAPFRALGLGPVAVAPERQRQGLGAALIRAGLTRAAADGWQGVFVLGEPAYYRRFGFDPALAAGFDSPYAGPYLMALALNGPLPARAGRIDYAPAFAALG